MPPPVPPSVHLLAGPHPRIDLNPSSFLNQEVEGWGIKAPHLPPLPCSMLITVMFGGKWGRLSPQTGGGQCTQGLASLCLAEGRGAVQGRGVHMGQGMGNLGKWLCAEVRPGPGVPLGENSSGVLGNSQEFLWWHFFKPQSLLALQSVVLKPRGTQAPEALDTGAGSSASRRGWSGIRPGMRGSSCASASQETAGGGAQC